MGHCDGGAHAMNYVWEEDIDIFAKDLSKARPSWHLKKLIPADPGSRPPWRLGTGPYKISCAWVTREGERKYKVRFVTMNHNDKTFRSLKAAKAYALAIATLDT